MTKNCRLTVGRGISDVCRAALIPSMTGSHIYEGGEEWSLRRNLCRVLKVRKLLLPKNKESKNKNCQWDSHYNLCGVCNDS